MDNRTFDRMTRLFAGQRSRRSLLGAITAGLTVLTRDRTAAAQPICGALCSRTCGSCDPETGACVGYCRGCEVCRNRTCRNACTGGRVCSDSGCVPATCAPEDKYCGECAGGGKACCPPHSEAGLSIECAIQGPGGEYGAPVGGRVCAYWGGGEFPKDYKYTCMPA